MDDLVNPLIWTYIYYGFTPPSFLCSKAMAPKARYNGVLFLRVLSPIALALRLGTSLYGACPLYLANCTSLHYRQRLLSVSAMVSWIRRVLHQSRNR
ncbi:MAG: hypothetical protein GPOALKHO_000321 [Sodalis sp.]|nr:MAG: hypothetical protein GPOALKHO_000321 [Sodalis sp.]